MRALWEVAPAEVVNQGKARLADWEQNNPIYLKGMLDSLS